MSFDHEQAIRARARELCEAAGLEPDVMAVVGSDDFGAIREANWEMFREEAEEQINAGSSSLAARSASGSKEGCREDLGIGQSAMEVGQ